MKNLFLSLILISLYSCNVKMKNTKEKEYQDSILVVTDAVKDSSSSHIPSEIDTFIIK